MHDVHTPYGMALSSLLSLVCACHRATQASLKADQAKLSDLQQQEAQMEQSAEQVTQQAEELAAKMDELKKQVGPGPWIIKGWTNPTCWLQAQVGSMQHSRVFLHAGISFVVSGLWVEAQ
jgi:hypothetical protein